MSCSFLLIIVIQSYAWCLYLLLEFLLWQSQLSSITDIFILIPWHCFPIARISWLFLWDSSSFLLLEFFLRLYVTCCWNSLFHILVLSPSCCSFLFVILVLHFLLWKFFFLLVLFLYRGDYFMPCDVIWYMRKIVYIRVLNKENQRPWYRQLSVESWRNGRKNECWYQIERQTTSPRIFYSDTAMRWKPLEGTGEKKQVLLWDRDKFLVPNETYRKLHRVISVRRQVADIALQKWRSVSSTFAERKEIEY